MYGVYGVYVARATLDKPRRRQIKWEQTTDDAAIDLAHRRNFKGNVTKLLEALIYAEAKRKRGVDHAG